MGHPANSVKHLTYSFQFSESIPVSQMENGEDPSHMMPKTSLCNAKQIGQGTSEGQTD